MFVCYVFASTSNVNNSGILQHRIVPKVSKERYCSCTHAHADACMLCMHVCKKTIIDNNSSLPHHRTLHLVGNERYCGCTHTHVHNFAARCIQCKAIACVEKYVCFLGLDAHFTCMCAHLSMHGAYAWHAYAFWGGASDLDQHNFCGP